MRSPSGADFRGVLLARLRDHVADADTAFEPPVAEPPVDGGVADIHLPGALAGGVVIEVGRDDVYPRGRDVVDRARGHADALDADFFATCNSNDLFLFASRGERDVAEAEFRFRYFDLRDARAGEFVPEFLSAVERAATDGDFPAQPERDRTAGDLRSFHSSVWPTYGELAASAYGADEAFTRAFDEWVRVNDYGGRDREALFELSAKQYASLLVGRVLSGEGDPETASGDPHHRVRTGDGPTGDGADHASASGARPDLFGTYPENARTRRTLADFVANVESGPSTRPDEDLLGDVYEEAIPADERRALGQFYTHPKIAETVCRWAIGRPRRRADADRDDASLPRVLDPACGCGTFTVEAYDVLREAYPDRDRRRVVDSLVAVDVNRVPLQLAALNVQGRESGEGTGNPRFLHGSFFDLAPGADRPGDPGTDVPHDGGVELGTFDAVVGNPPYIRQEDLYPDKEHFRAHLSAFGRPGASPYDDGPKSLSKRSDAYVYFVTHATRFLDDGGRLGFVVPTKWLTTEYGEPFQQFLHDHFEITAVVGFGPRAFEDALVDAALLLLRRCTDEGQRRANTTAFVRVKETMEPGDILDAVAGDRSVTDGSYVEVRNRPAYRTTAVDQSYLMDAGPGKLSPYLRAPVEFIRLLEHPALVPLAELGDTHRGVMTGANDFFFVDDRTLASWDIDERFLHPAIKSVRDVEGRVVRESGTDRYLLDVDDYVTRVERDGRGPAESGLEARVTDALARDGYDDTLAYIEWGERESYHERRSCASRTVWFNLGELDPPEILHPKFYDDRVHVVWNPDRLVPSNAVDCVRLHDDVDEAAMRGVLDSTVYKALLETWGRAEGGGALQLMTYEVSTVPVVDVRELDAGTRQRLAAASDALVAGEDGAQRALDRLVLDALGVDVDVDRFRELYDAMVERRTRGGGEAEVLVERMDRLERTGRQSFER